MRLLEAWSLVARRVAPVQLVIAGHWDTRFPQVQDCAATLGLEGSTRFLGPVPEEDLPALYSGAEWALLPRACCLVPILLSLVAVPPVGDGWCRETHKVDFGERQDSEMTARAGSDRQ